MSKRVAFLISGGGSNMEVLACSMADDHPAYPVMVISNVTDAGGLARAQALGIDTAVLDHKPYGKDRTAFDAALHDMLLAARPDIICHAGFMRILTPDMVTKWQGKMLNIHPSLLPRHKGLHTHRKAIEAGDAEHGCSVHEVTAELDGGPILGQARLKIAPDDTPETLAARVLPLEHQLYPAVLRRFAAGDRRLVSLG